jgi:chromosome segregation ATPase
MANHGTNFVGAGHRLEDAPGDSQRMIKLRADIKELPKSIAAASQALQELASQENELVDEELTRLDQALDRSSRILADILNQHQRPQDDDLPPALGLAQLNAILPTLHDLVEGLKDADRHANASLRGSQSHRERLIEHNNQYLKPVHATLGSIETNVDAEEGMLEANVNKTATDAEVAKEDVEELSTQVREKQTEIKTHEEDLRPKREAASELERRAEEALRKSAEERREAERLRDVRFPHPIPVGLLYFDSVPRC